MTLEEFLSLTSKRLPTPAELLEVCDSLGIAFVQDSEGRPAVKHGGLKDEAMALVALLKREPWRAQVIAAKGLTGGKPAVGQLPAEDVAPRWKEFLWRDGHLYRQPPGEAASTPAGSWWWRFAGEAAWRLTPGREEYARGHEPPAVEVSRAG